MLLKPLIVKKTVTDIDVKLLSEYKIKALLLDLDNTLSTHNSMQPADGVPEWVKKMTDSGIKLIIVSNNSGDRVKPFADMLGLDFVAWGAKPLTIGFNRARKCFGLDYSDIAVVGDQLFTDMLGANIVGIKTIYVFPIQAEKGFLFKIKRLAEKPFLPKL